MAPTDRRLSRRHPRDHLGPQRRRRGSSDVRSTESYQRSFGREVREQLGELDVAHPVVGVRARARRARCARADGAAPRGELGSQRGTVLPHARASRPWPCCSRRSLGPALAAARRAAAPTDKVTFTVALTNEVDSFNPFLGIEADVVRDVGADLRLPDQLLDEGHVARSPGWPKSWDTSDDGLTWTFHIRDGVKWSDGEPLTADGHRLHLQPDPRRRTRGGDLGVAT